MKDKIRHWKGWRSIRVLRDALKNMVIKMATVSLFKKCKKECANHSAKAPYKIEKD
jgi:hypothetical protein